MRRPDFFSGSLFLLLATTQAADLTQEWTKAPLYNKNAGFCSVAAGKGSWNPQFTGYVLVQNGQIIAEDYQNPDDLTHVGFLWSATKSWTSLLIGRMIQEGRIALTETLGEIFGPENDVWEVVNDQKEDFQAVTIRELLTMSSGLREDVTNEELNGPLPADGTLPTNLPDSLEENLAMIKYYPEQKGSYYYMPVTNLLAHVIEYKLANETVPPESGKPSALDYATSMTGMFPKLGMRYQHNYDWDQLGGIEGSAFGLRSTTRVLAKLGQLYLQNGNAFPEADDDSTYQLVNSDWINASTSNQTAGVPDVASAYGYLWYSGFSLAPDTYMAAGAGGQLLVVYPSFNAVLATTTRAYGTATGGTGDILQAIAIPMLAGQFNIEQECSGTDYTPPELPPLSAIEMPVVVESATASKDGIVWATTAVLVVTTMFRTTN